MDDERGIANADGIPWNLPTDVAYFREKTLGASVVMGYKTYIEFASPLKDRANIVVVREGTDLRKGFVGINNVEKFLDDSDEDVWVIGGAALFAKVFLSADELYITHIDRNFSCTRFFPDFKDAFELKAQGELKHENDIDFRFAIYRRKII